MLWNTKIGSINNSIMKFISNFRETLFNLLPSLTVLSSYNAIYILKQETLRLKLFKESYVLSK